MTVQSPKVRRRPEARIQAAIIKYLREREWFVKNTVGNMYQSGFPDLYCCHRKYGARWVEVKLPGMKGSKFTPAQILEFPMFAAHGAGIWILTAATEEEYKKLFKPCNFWQYWS